MSSHLRRLDGQVQLPDRTWERLKVIDEKYKVQNNLITGCQSRVWLHAEYKDGKVCFLPTVMR